MTLTSGRGPLGPNPAGWFSAPVPPGTVLVEPHPRRVTAVRGGRPVIDTELALLVHRPGHPPAYAFPAGLVDDLPATPEPAAPGYVQVRWDAMDEWFEEGRRLVSYPPNPYHRVDYRPTRRHLRVVVAGTTVVDTDDTIICFETALSPRLYVRPELVRTDLLHPTDTWSYCNYKGEATWWAASIEGRIVGDVAWTYEDPLPESLPIRGWFSFDPDRAEVHAEVPGPDEPDECTTECAPPVRAEPGREP